MKSAEAAGGDWGCGRKRHVAGRETKGELVELWSWASMCAKCLSQGRPWAKIVREGDAMMIL